MGIGGYLCLTVSYYPLSVFPELHIRCDSFFFVLHLFLMGHDILSYLTSWLFVLTTPLILFFLNGNQQNKNCCSNNTHWIHLYSKTYMFKKKTQESSEFGIRGVIFSHWCDIFQA